MKKDIISGLALGLLVGIIIGLSIAQVTGIILGSLTSLLAAFFGLRPTKEGEVGNKTIIGAFSISCLLAILFGIYMRTHDLLAPSLQSEIKSYKEAQFTTQEIKDILYLKKFGLVPQSGYTYSSEAMTNAQLKSTVLMAGENDELPLCISLDDSSSLDDIIDAFNASGGNYQRLQQGLSNAISNEETLRVTLLHIKQLLCDTP